MKKGLFLVLLLLAIRCSWSFSQENRSIYFVSDLGVAFGIGEDITNIYGVGGQVSVGLGFPVTERVLIIPNASISYFGNNTNESTRDNLFLWNVGGLVQVNISNSDRLDISPFIGLNYLIGNNYLAPRADFQGDRIDMYTFNGYSIDTGIKLSLPNNLFFQVRLRIMNPDGEVDERIQSEIRNELAVANSLYDLVSFSDDRFSLSSISIAIGYSLRLK